MIALNVFTGLSIWSVPACSLPSNSPLEKGVGGIDLYNQCFTVEVESAILTGSSPFQVAEVTSAPVLGNAL
ncbi:MAG: hypothetical protein MI975_15125 [Cytophagales bacterium]|nr:hypothetical protein [Cytophagales bacterium]